MKYGLSYTDHGNMPIVVGIFNSLEDAKSAALKEIIDNELSLPEEDRVDINKIRLSWWEHSPGYWTAGDEINEGMYAINEIDLDEQAHKLVC